MSAFALAARMARADVLDLFESRGFAANSTATMRFWQRAPAPTKPPPVLIAAATRA